MSPNNVKLFFKNQTYFPKALMKNLDNRYLVAKNS